LIELAKKSEKFGNSQMVVDKEQNIYILGVKEEFLDQFKTNLSPFYNHQIACSGEKFCQYGLVDSKELSAKLIKHLEKNILSHDIEISFYWSGCSRGCARHLLGDIGFQGYKHKQKIGVKIFICGKEVIPFAEPERINVYVEKIIKNIKK